jgi:DNA-3-methyladenine glycosylase II
VLEAATGQDAFAELALHIVSQQISTAAALTIFGRLRSTLHGTVAPAPIVGVSIDELRAAGLSVRRQGPCATSPNASSTAACRSSGSPSATTPPRRPSSNRCAASGRGRRRCSCCTTSGARDVLPAVDVGLLRAAQSAFALAQRPTADELAERAERWRPFRSYAAALLWAHCTEHPTTRSET